MVLRVCTSLVQTKENLLLHDVLYTAGGGKYVILDYDKSCNDFNQYSFDRHCLYHYCQNGKR